MLNGNKDKARQMYEGLDRDGSGLLERRELYVLMKRLIPGATQKELKMTLAELQAAYDPYLPPYTHTTKTSSLTLPPIGGRCMRRMTLLPPPPLVSNP